MPRVSLPLGLLLLGLGGCGRGEASNRATESKAQVTAPVAASVLASADASAAPPPSAAPPDEQRSNCLEQAPQEFLVKAHLSGHALTTAHAQQEWWAALQRSIRYRTEQYGYYSGFGERAWNPRPLASQIHTVKFAGLPVQMHDRVVPALRCVEQAISRDCQERPYRPHTLAGVRQKNTYFGGDVTNHVYGIAVDIDPSQNPCCNCTEPWRSSPRCRGSKTDFERMAMPECWVTAFERYGFYWLGHDELKDTMHFEFLGDPAKIEVSAVK